MADRIFLFRCHLCGGDVKTIGKKNRVIAKATHSATLREQDAIDLALHDILFAGRQHQRRCTSKVRGASGRFNLTDLL